MLEEVILVVSWAMKYVRVCDPLSLSITRIDSLYPCAGLPVPYAPDYCQVLGMYHTYQVVGK